MLTHLQGLAVGDRVTHIRLNRAGEIVALTPNSITINFGNETVTFDEAQIRRGPQGLFAKIQGVSAPQLLSFPNNV